VAEASKSELFSDLEEALRQVYLLR